MTAKDFITSLPEKINPSAIEGMSTVFHFDISGDEGGQYTVTVDDGKIDVKDGLEGESKCSVKAKDADLVGLVTGKLNPMMALMMGKVKISNQGEMLKYAKAFGLM